MDNFDGEKIPVIYQCFNLWLKTQKRQTAYMTSWRTPNTVRFFVNFWSRPPVLDSVSILKKALWFTLSMPFTILNLRNVSPLLLGYSNMVVIVNTIIAGLVDIWDFSTWESTWWPLIGLFPTSTLSRWNQGCQMRTDHRCEPICPSMRDALNGWLSLQHAGGTWTPQDLSRLSSFRN